MRYIVTLFAVYSSVEMTAKKTTTLNLRIDPAVKEALKLAAGRDHRSITNFVELLVRKHCEQAGIAVPEQQTFSEETHDGH